MSFQINENILFKDVAENAIYKITCSNCGAVLLRMRFTFDGAIKFHCKCKRCGAEKTAEGHLDPEPAK